MGSNKYLNEPESREYAKKRISECLNEIDEKIYPSEIADRLHIDYGLCIEIIEELLKEGKIEIAGTENEK